MITVEVYRGDGTMIGDPIIEPLLADQEALIERGRVELNDRAHAKTSVTIRAVPTSNVRPGQLVEVFSATHGQRFRGKVVGVEHRAQMSDSDVQAETIIDIERAA